MRIGITLLSIFLWLLSFSAQAAMTVKYEKTYGNINTLHAPNDVATDQEGNLYITDTNNHRIRVFKPNGQFLLEWGEEGSDNHQLSSPAHIAINNGRVYVADTGNYRIQVFTKQGRFLSTIDTSINNRYVAPRDLAFDSNGNLYLLSSESLRVFDSNGEFLKYIGYGYFRTPYGIALDSEDNIYVVDKDLHEVFTFDHQGTFIRDFSLQYGADAQEVAFPESIAIDSNHHIYIADTGNHRIHIYDREGSFIETRGHQGNKDYEFNTPSSITIDTGNNIYIADKDNHRIQVLDINKNLITSIGRKPGELLNPWSVSLDNDNNVYVTDAENHRIIVYTRAGNFLREWTKRDSHQSNLYSPYDVEVDNHGNVYTLGRTNQVHVFNKEGVFLREWGGYGRNEGQLNLPQGLALDSSGNVYVADTVNHRIQVFSNNGTFLRQWGNNANSPGQLNFPRDLVLDSLDNIYVLDAGNHLVKVFSKNGTFLKAWSPGSDQAIHGIALVNDKKIYLSYKENNQIRVFDTMGKFLGKWGDDDTHDTTLNAPNKIGVDHKGKIYVADSGNARIQAFSTLFDNEAPSFAVSNLTAIPLIKGKIKLKWHPSDGNEKKYRIERCIGHGCNDFRKIKTITAHKTQTTIPAPNELLDGTSYTFKVIAFNQYGEAPASEPVTVSFNAMQGKPGALLAISRADGSTYLKWKSTTQHAAHIDIERCKGKNCSDFSTIKRQTTKSASRYTDHDVVADKYYRYRITAVAVLDGSKKTSNIVQVRGSAKPPKPINLRAKNLDDQGTVQLNWKLPHQDSGYQTEVLRCRQVSLGSCKKVTTLPGGKTKTRLNLTQVFTPGVSYYFRLRTHNGFGNQYSNKTKLTFPDR